MNVKKRNFALLSVLLALIFQSWIAAQANRRVTRQMSWRYAEPSPRWPSSKHILLTFTDFPDESVGIYSRDLGGYLERLPDGQVPVVFEASPVFGGMHGRDWINPLKYLELDVGWLQGNRWYHAVQIGALTRWHSDFSYGGRRGTALAPSWD